MSTPIRLDRCAKTFADGTRALVPIDLEIAAGETVVLLGPSGCGKTTTLRLIAGLEGPDPGGRVLFGGDDVTALPIERRNVGMVFQSYALFPNMTVAQNVGYGLKVRRMPAAVRAPRVAEMLEMMRIADLADRRIDQLSGGQRQRVALARAIAPRPRVLLLDEPLTALDALLRERLRVDIDRLLRDLGITAVYVTHDQAEAMALGDRIVVMDRGCIAQIGTPADIYRRPATPFVADFIGTVNRLPLGPGGAERLCRPEDLIVLPPSASAADADLHGTVEAAFFLGSRTRVLVAGLGADPVVVDAPLAEEPAVGSPIALKVRDGALFGLPSA